MLVSTTLQDNQLAEGRTDVCIADAKLPQTGQSWGAHYTSGRSTDL